MLYITLIDTRDSMYSILYLIFGLGFLALGIRHNAQNHADEGMGGTGTILGDLFTGVLNLLPFWFAKILMILIGISFLIACLISYIK